MFTLLMILIALASIGFMWGGFIALIIFALAVVVGYFTGTLGALGVVLLVAIGSAIHKFDIINTIKNLKR